MLARGLPSKFLKTVTQSSKRGFTRIWPDSSDFSPKVSEAKEFRKDMKLDQKQMAVLTRKVATPNSLLTNSKNMK